MSRKGITYEAVSNAASAIKSRGQEPTIAAVRLECKEGSYTTISSHLSRWRTEETERIDSKSLPPEVEDAMMQAIMTVWNVSNKAAAADTMAIKQECADRLKEIKLELETAVREIKTLEDRNTEISNELINTKNQILNLERKLAEKASEAQTLKEINQNMIETIRQQAENQGEHTNPERQRPKVVSLQNKQVASQN